MQNKLIAVEIEVIVYGVENGLHMAAMGDTVVKVDLITADAVDVEEDVCGNVKLDGFWDEDVFVAENITYLH